ncbi:TetR/AcrR family transcriptional regulator [Thalassobaculum sp.]|uniref:TetR/AcrR family transcriptional regulator n=1 Tax=Thalassobaculum sp. TaxID=2022740 RepID=UPI003B5B1718
MQQTGRRTNEARSAATRAALIAAARALFVEKGYAETGTPEIVAAAQVTRGALYHHFADKADLFRAVVAAEAQAVAEAIDQATTHAASPRKALIEGTGTYFAAMTEPGRARLLLLDGPAVLGPHAMAELDRSTGGGTLRQGLSEAMRRVDPAELDALADCLSAAFDRAALAIAGGADPAAYCTAITRLIDAILRTSRP